jgi:hypothetical protein
MSPNRLRGVLAALGIAGLMVLLALLIPNLLAGAEGPDEPVNMAITIIDPPDGTEICVCEDFTVTALITNTGPSGGLWSVTGTLQVLPPSGATVLNPGIQVTPFITAGYANRVEWVLHCDAEGPTQVSIGAKYSTTWSLTDTIEILQGQPDAELEVTIDLPDPTQPISPCQDFNFRFTIQNIGAYTATGINVVVDPNEFASHKGDDPGSPLNVSIPDLGPGESDVDNVLVMHCEGRGDAIIVARPSGTDQCDGNPIPNDLLHEDEITVEQKVPAQLRVTSLGTYKDCTAYEIGGSPDCTDPDDQFIVCQNWWVKATVENIGDVNAIDVATTITLPASVSLVTPTLTIMDPSTIPGGGSASYWWEVHCDAEARGEVV